MGTEFEYINNVSANSLTGTAMYNSPNVTLGGTFYCSGSHNIMAPVAAVDGGYHATCVDCGMTFKLLHELPSGHNYEEIKLLLGELLALGAGVDDHPEFDFGKALGAYSELDQAIEEEEAELASIRKLLNMARTMIDQQARSEV